MRNEGWFADTNRESNPRWPWQPCLQTDSGCFDIEIWFQTEAECLAFIKSEIIGKGLMDE